MNIPMRFQTFLPSSCVLLVALAFSPRPLGAQSAANSITEEEIRDHIFLLASDSLGGRGTGQEGYLMAARYAAAQLQESGVDPLDLGEGGTGYFQDLPLVRTSFGDGNRATLSIASTSESLAFGRDYLVMASRSGAVEEVSGDLIFAGFGITDSEKGWDDLADLSLSGAVVVVMFDQPGGEITNAFAGDRDWVSWQGFGRKIDLLEARGASAVVAIPEVAIFDNWDRMAGYFTSGSVAVAGASRGSRLPDADIPAFILSREVVNELFEDQVFNPVTGEGDYSTFALPAARMEVVVESLGEEMNVPNVIGFVEGTDPGLREEYIVIGAHLDHLGLRNGQIYNGADDNASGSVGVLEIAEATALAPPKRSCVFVLFAGEEMGILGSSYFVDNPPVPLDRVKAMVNLEMIGRYDHRPLGTGQLFAIVGTQEGEAMRETVREINGRGYDYEWEIPEQFMGGSDHIPFERAEIPNITVAGSPPYDTHEDYHRVGDDAEKIDTVAMRKTVAFIYELVMELANR